MRTHENFDDALEDTARAILRAANLMAETINLAPEDVDTVIYWNVMDWLRDTADRIDPPQEDWPENIVPLVHKKRQG